MDQILGQIEEHLETYIVIGYDMEGNRFIAHSDLTTKDIDALVNAMTDIGIDLSMIDEEEEE